MNSAISVAGLRVRRGSQEVLHGLDLEVMAGSVTGLLGPSGCGKTTLLRCIVGAQRGVRGIVRVLGLPAGSAALRGRIGYVTQAPSVYADLTVAENLRYFAAVLSATHDEVDWAIEAVALRSHASQLVGQLSGGQRARVSLASALLGHPEILVLDEPTVGLDPLLRTELWQLFHELAGSGTTLLISSHVMDEAERCDDLLLMREGQLLATGAPGSLLRRTGAPDLEAAFVALIEEGAHP